MRSGTLYRAITHNPAYARMLFIALIVFSLTLIVLFTPRIPQWPDYHHFADTRTFWGIPNFWNVISNLPFILISILGFISLKKQADYLNKKERIVFFILFLGAFFIGLGSSYYHWAPDNNTLVWDRIPMTVVFMSLLSLTIMERVNLNLGFWLLIPLIAFGICSVLYWHHTELTGQGDIRLYAITQFYSMFVIMFVLLLFPKPYPPLNRYLWMFLFYGLAKMAEYFDRPIYNLGHVLSGHTLKHFLAATSVYFVVVILNDSLVKRANSV
ncbi:ceramidase domain-containing protein [Legionella shakespearei]|uniref:Ceramidase n=1 Tax=Legionella shakespearei DSM 23087 TaxID=1122169 RepID=A0A0W0Z027_9GAMM|nr:ceramidase domain-containing protein [Legionella shakespearei]KTD62493.1 Ceramidase [Legionella shakespearei DSM 23087]